MATFKAGVRDWIVALDGPTIRRIRQQFEIPGPNGELIPLDLIGADGRAYDAMIEDPTLLVDVLWALCQKQADGLKIDAEQFGQMLVGDPIDEAARAMKEAILDFSPSQRRKLVRALADKNAELRAKGIERALARIEDPAFQEKALAALEADMDAAINQALTRLSSATSSPASAESSPRAEPTGS